MNELTARLAVFLAVLSPLVAAADEPTGEKLGLFVSTGFLSSPAGQGAAVSGGVRLGLGKHFAAGFDVGYGVMSTTPSLQDRWWLMPSVALVIPAGRLRLDLGLGAGFAESSGFDSVARLTADKPTWSYQLIPTVRAHALVATQLTQRLDLFARIDAAALLFEGNTIGLREGEPRKGLTDSTWLNLSIGINFRLL